MHKTETYLYPEKELRESAVLTDSYVEATTEDVASVNQVMLYVTLTLGSLTSAQIKVEVSPDNTTFYRLPTQRSASGTITLNAGVYTISADGNYVIPIESKYKIMKVSVKGTGTVTSSLMGVKIQLGII